MYIVYTLYIYYIGLVLYLYTHTTHDCSYSSINFFFLYIIIIVHYINPTAFDPGEYNSI